MIEETSKYIAVNFPGLKKAGLLATTGMIVSNVYKYSLKRKNIELIVPSVKSQETLVMRAIYGKKGIKAGHKTVLPRKLLLNAAKEIINKGAEIVILGCTEIPLVLKNDDLKVPVVDPTEILARAAVERAMNKIKPDCIPRAVTDFSAIIQEAKKT